jgi:hypothetical protein
MMDLTVRRVATFLRLPWWISIVTIFLLGREKQTARWERSFVSLPGGEQVVSDLEYQWFEYRREVARWVDWVYAGNVERFEGKPTSRAFYRDDAGSNVDLDILGDLELLLRVDVQHLEKPLAVEKWRDLEIREVAITAKEIRGSKLKCAR